MKCLFPVAGLGIRFPPATKAQPKEMLPILTKPLIQYGAEEALDAGMKNIAFATGQTNAPSRIISASPMSWKIKSEAPARKAF
ncbi:MAG: sugar phosphate nucleotidyltransferase [Gallionella sp.]|nr:sugar phosphate nucleotidyltransferase [Gallionella sp.]